MRSVLTPHFEQAGYDDAAPRLLIISAAFPPSAGPGAVRLERIASMAASRGWQVDAVTSANAPHERYDDTRLHELPPGTRVYCVPVHGGGVIDLPLGAMRAFKRLTASKAFRSGTDGSSAGESASSGMPVVNDVIRRVRGLRDFAQWRQWATDAATLAKRVAKSRLPLAILSSGPPHMAHEAARRVARSLDRPLVLDFRDPWVIDGSIAGRQNAAASDGWIRAHEERVCREADLVVLNTDATRDAFAARYPDLRAKMLTIMNGADPDVKAYSSTTDQKFTIAHAGELYEGRDPRPFLRGVGRFLRRCPAAVHDVRVRFVGSESYHGSPLEAIAEAEGVQHVFEHSGPVSRKEALILSGSAAVNVVLQQDATNSIPSKVFDYVQYPSTIVALCHPVDATRRLLEGTAAIVLAPDDVEGIADGLETTYQNWRSGRRPEPLNADGRFDRARHLERLLDAIERTRFQTAAP